MHLFRIALVGFLFATGTLWSADKAPKWTVDSDHSSIEFKVKHLFTPVTGTFDSYEGRVLFDPDRPELSEVEFTIPVDSVNTRSTKRDKHLQSDAFFDARQWPTIHFISTSVSKVGEMKYLLKGRLTIRAITHEVEIPFTLLGMDDVRLGIFKTKVAGIELDYTLNRNDYGVGTGSWAATAVVGDEVQIHAQLELHR